MFGEGNGLDVVVELEGGIDLDQADVVDDDAGIVILRKRNLMKRKNEKK